MDNSIQVGQDKQEVRVLQDSVLAMAVESWRMFKVLERLLNSLDAKDQNRYQSKIRWFMKKTEESLNASGFKFVNYEGHPYDPGIPAAPLNLDEFKQDERLYVSQMLEPVIVDQTGRIVKAGTIFLGRFE